MAVASGIEPAASSIELLTQWRRRTPAAGCRPPFFLYLAFAEPHGTIASPDRFNAQYAAHTAGRPDPLRPHAAAPKLAAHPPRQSDR